MTRHFLLVFTALTLLGGAGWGDSGATVDDVSVKVEKRNGRDWCTMAAQVSVDVRARIDDFLATVGAFDRYPEWQHSIKEIHAEPADGSVVITEKVVVSALGIENINRFSLRIVTAETGKAPRSVRVSWTQEKTDGSIDSLAGEWVLEDRGDDRSPLTHVVYRTRSAVPMVVFGQDTLLRMFLGGEYKSFVEAVAKAAVSR